VDLFPKPRLKVRIKEAVGFVGPIMATVQVKGGDYGRFFWRNIPDTPEMTADEAYRFAIKWCIKHKARLIP
jgi:predicted N-acyltransferase